MSAREVYAQIPDWERELLREHLYAELDPGAGSVSAGAAPPQQRADSPFAAPPDLKGI